MSNLNGAIHVGLAQVGIKDEGDKRAFYMRLTGKAGLTVMSDPEKEAVVMELRRMGFKPALKRVNGRRKLTGKYRPKLQALWIAGYNLGIINNPDDAAMLDFIKDVTGADDTRFLFEHKPATAAIEGLKAWLAREAGVVWVVHPSAPPWAHTAGYRVAKAQWAILMPRGTHLFWSHVNDILDRDEVYLGHTDAEWITVMNYLGKRIRQEKKAGAK